EDADARARGDRIGDDRGVVHAKSHASTRLPDPLEHRDEGERTIPPDEIVPGQRVRGLRGAAGLEISPRRVHRRSEEPHPLHGDAVLIGSDIPKSDLRLTMSNV